MALVDFTPNLARQTTMASCRVGGATVAEALQAVFEQLPDRTLAFGSTTGSVWISENDGDTWHRLSADLPPVYCVRFA